MEDKDYKKLYEEAIERAKYALTTDMDNSGHWAVNYIFPQLKENKDEKVMKALIHLVNSNKEGSFGIDNYDGIKWDDILSWIEIQGEHKHFRDCIQTGDEVTRNQDGDIVNLSQLKRITKLKPKFKTDDWVQIDGGHVMKILEVKKDVLCYRILNWCGNESVRKISDIDSIAHLWTIQDAKNGDVLAYNDGSLTIFRYRLSGLDAGLYMSYVLLTDKIEFKQTCAISNVHPATKEQSDLLFQKMKETGYEWDFEKKELRTIEQKSTWSEEDLTCLGYLAKFVDENGDSFYGKNKQNVVKWIQSFANLNPTQKQEWSEEDEKMWSQVINEIEAIKSISSTIFEKNIAQDKIDWLKSIKDRVQPKQEWSEEDKSMYIRTLGILGKCYMGELPTKVEEELEWLKSVELQSHWKPSEEQLKTLWDAIVYVEDNNSNFVGGCMLESLYKDLKKL